MGLVGASATLAFREGFAAVAVVVAVAVVGGDTMSRGGRGGGT